MINKELRLFVVYTKLTTAEKMQLHKFLAYGEYLAYSLKLNHIPHDQLTTTPIEDFKFDFRCEIENDIYEFSHHSLETNDAAFASFEIHLSTFLNELFDRKNKFEQNTEDLKRVVEKINSFPTKERELLATHISTNPNTILQLLGVVDDA